MKKTKFTEAKIVAIIKENEAGISAPELARKYGMSQGTFYNWKAKYGGIGVSDLKRLKEIENENRRLKQMYADLSLGHEVLKDIIEKKL